MISTVVSDYPWYFFIPCFLTAAVLTAVSYYKNKKLTEFQPFKIYVLSGLRFFALFLTGLLLLNIFVKTTSKRVEKPILAMVADNSESMLLRFKDEPQKFLQSEFFAAKQKLEEKYNVKYFKFGENLSQALGAEDFKFDEKYTDFSNMFDGLKSVLYNTNSGAVVLLSDGISNKGQNPVYAASSSGQKIFTVTLGDTTSYKDLSISKVRYNETAFLDNEFPLEISINAKMLKDKQTVCQIFHDGKKVFETPVQIKSDGFSTEVSTTLKASKKGLQKYEIHLKSLEGEITEVNNSREIIIEVIDDKYKVLLLSAMPHPDVAALRNALSQNLSYDLEVAMVEDFNKKISTYDLVILFQLPSLGFNTERIFEEIKSKNVPTLFVLGHQTDYQKFSQVNSCLEIVKNGNNFDDALFMENSGFSVLTFENGVEELLKSSPPLSCAFGEYKLLPRAQAFAYQTIRGVNTSKPLIVVSEPGKTKSAVIAGEGLWRWRIDSYRRFLNHEKFDLFVTRLSQFLLKRSDREMFSLSAKKIFSENEPVYFNAKLFDKAFEPISDGNITMEIVSQDGVKSDYKFENTGSGYYLRIDNLLPGVYDYKAVAVSNGSASLVKTGSFTIKEIKTEAENLTADFSVMQKISSSTSGKSYFSENFSSLVDDLMQNSAIKPVVYNDITTSSLMSKKILFFIILLLFSAEWFLRKYWGTL